MKRRKLEKRKLNKKKERSCCKKKHSKKNRARGVKVPILNLPRPPCPVLRPCFANRLRTDCVTDCEQTANRLRNRLYFKFAETLHT